MALKGGTGIRKVHLDGYRFSDDLDFTLLKEYDVGTISEGVSQAVKVAGNRSGVRFMDDVTVKEVDNGFTASGYFRIIRSTGNPLRIKLDLTRVGNEVILLPLVNKPVIHPFSDMVQGSVSAYCLEEVFAEKIRALFQRTRPRDLYDVWRLSEKGLDVSGIIEEKFRFKGVAFDLDDLHDRKDDFRFSWESSLSHQLRDFPDFNEVYGSATSYLDKIQHNVNSKVPR